MEELAAKKLTITPEALDLLMEKIWDLQRSSEYPSNARDVIKVINEDIIPRQITRVSSDPNLSEEQICEIIAQDVGYVRPETPEAILEEFDRTVVGNGAIKEFLISLWDQVSFNRANGLPITNDVKFAIALSGPPGTGKTNVFAPLFGRFYRALGLLPSAECHVKQGGNLVGLYVGASSANAVIEFFSQACGKVGVIDEISGIASAPMYRDQSIKAMLPRLEEKRCLIVVADYGPNIQRFFSLDQGLSGRFVEVSTEPFSAKSTFDSLKRELESKKIDTSLLNERKILVALEILVRLPDFHNGRDIKTNMAPAIASSHRRAIRIDPSAKLTTAKLTTELVLAELKQFTDTVRERGVSTLAASQGIPPDLLLPQFRQLEKTPTRRSVNNRRPQARTPVKRADLHKALKKVNRAYAKLANDNPQAFNDQLKNPKSKYITDLAKELKIKPQEALAALKAEEKLIGEEMKSAVTDIDTVTPDKKKLVFDYHCPFCRKVNSLNCDYYSRSEAVRPDSFEYSNEWLISYSLKKPHWVDVSG
jgi:hypothetical protein